MNVTIRIESSTATIEFKEQFTSGGAASILRFALRRGGRVAEGAPLLREYGYKPPIEGSNPSLSAKLSKPATAGLLNLAPGTRLVRSVWIDADRAMFRTRRWLTQFHHE